MENLRRKINSILGSVFVLFRKVDFVALIFIVIILLVSVFFGLLLKMLVFPRTGGDGMEEKVSEEYIEFSDGRQIISVKAKNGFSPGYIIAKSGVDTILRIKTDNTVDCSSIINIPALGIYERLPITGEKDINIGVRKPGDKITASCSSGSNVLKIRFM